MSETTMLPLTAAAELMKTTPLNVLMHIKRGLLQGVETNAGWLVEQAGLEALLTSPGGKSADVCASGCGKKHACGGCG